MHKLLKTVIVLTTMLLTIFPFMTTKAAPREETVTTQDELKQAINDAEVTTIILGNDIETTEKINVLRPVIIDGNGKKITYVGTFGPTASTDNKVWAGIYVLQIYNTTATIKDITLTGGNAGLLINGSDVTLEGAIDVSGNGAGGIELGIGSGLTTVPKLELPAGSTVVNTTETTEQPTFWVPAGTTGATIKKSGVVQQLSAGKDVYLDTKNEPKEEENPETSDSAILFLGFAIIALGGMAISFKKISA